MNSVRRIVLALAALALPASAFAQATLSGVVKDIIRRRAAGRDGRSIEPGADREDTNRRQRRHGPVPTDRAAARHLHGDVHAQRLQYGQARRTSSVSGAGVITINADLKVGSVSETITVTGETPIVDIQSATRQEVLTNDVVKTLPVTRSYDSLLTAVPGGERRQPRRHAVADDADLHEPRRPRQRGQHGARRPQCRRGVQRRRRVRLHHRYGERPGSADEPVGRSRRNGKGRHLSERRSEDRRQHVQGRTLRQRRGLVVAGQQPGRLAAARSAFRTRRRFIRTTTSADRSAVRSGRTRSGSTAASATSARRRTSRARTPTPTPATRTRGRTSPNTAITDRNASSQGIYSGRVTWQATPRNKFSFYEDHQMQVQPGVVSAAASAPVATPVPTGWRPGRSAPFSRRNRSRPTTRSRRTSGRRRGARRSPASCCSRPGSRAT